MISTKPTYIYIERTNMFKINIIEDDDLIDKDWDVSQNVAVGDWFKIKNLDNQQESIGVLALTGNNFNVAFLCFHIGNVNRYMHGCTIKDIKKITPLEFQKILGNDGSEGLSYQLDIERLNGEINIFTRTTVPVETEKLPKDNSDKVFQEMLKDINDEIGKIPLISELFKKGSTYSSGAAFKTTCKIEYSIPHIISSEYF